MLIQQSLDLTSSFRLRHPLWISTVNFYDDVTLNSDITVLFSSSGLVVQERLP